MKNKKVGLVLSLFALYLQGLAQKGPPAAALPGAPTGTYKNFTWPERPSTNQLPFFTLNLETNGTYVAQTTQGPNGREVARGNWRWDAQGREFRLEPGNFVFYIKRLPVDQQHTNRLVWGNSWLVREENK